MDATYIFLQQYWWFLVSLLGALLVFCCLFREEIPYCLHWDVRKKSAPCW